MEHGRAEFGNGTYNEESLGRAHKILELLCSSESLGFGWQVMLGRLPTKVKLMKRRSVLIGSQQLACVLGNEHFESSADLFFFSCKFAYIFWSYVYAWCGDHDKVIFIKSAQNSK
ncbi:hypothetical protein Lal_00026434 [Lupinus albus]|nr:hypothetical protein Lal_00026434 [Lupinus albus]